MEPYRNRTANIQVGGQKKKKVNICWVQPIIMAEVQIHYQRKRKAGQN